MQRRLQEYDVFKWVNDFMDQLVQVKQEQRKQKVRVLDDKTFAAIYRHYHGAKNRCLLLDYDGTLVPFTRIPSEASPDSAVRDLLDQAGRRPEKSCRHHQRAGCLFPRTLAGEPADHSGGGAWREFQNAERGLAADGLGIRSLEG